MFLMKRTLVLLLAITVVTVEADENCLVQNTDHGSSNEIRVMDRPRVNDMTFDNVCACLERFPAKVDFMRCPSVTPFIKSVRFVRCGQRAIPTGINCIGL